MHAIVERLHKCAITHCHVGHCLARSTLKTLVSPDTADLSIVYLDVCMSGLDSLRPSVEVEDIGASDRCGEFPGGSIEGVSYVVEDVGEFDVCWRAKRSAVA